MDKRYFQVKKIDLSFQTGTHGLPSHPGPAEVHSHVEFLKPKKQAIGETASPWNKDKQGHLLQGLAIQELWGEMYPKQCSLAKDVTLQCCCFSCFPHSMFGCQWEAVGERGRGRALERQGSWLENTAENLGACRFIFSLFLP